MAPKIDFYIIPEKTAQEALLFACRLIEKAYNNNNTCYIHVEDEAQAQKLNTMLWTFRDISFIPHDIAGSQHSDLPIQIGYGVNQSIQISDILLNLSNTVPNFYNNFNRVIEIVPDEPMWQNNARQNYRYYQQNGFTINNHDLRK